MPCQCQVRRVVGRVDRERTVGNDEATRSQSSDSVHVRLREVPNGETVIDDIPTQQSNEGGQDMERRKMVDE
jgi:hypothetical protein